MNFQTNLEVISSLATAFCVLSSTIARECGPIGHKLCAGGAMVTIIANALLLHYNFSVTKILIIYLAGIIIFVAGKNVGKAAKREEANQSDQ